MSSPPEEITSFLTMTSTQAVAWIAQLMSSASTPSEKLKAISFCKKIMSSDRSTVVGYSGMLATVDADVKAQLAALVAADPSIYDDLFVNLTPDVFYWNSGQTLQSKWKFTQTQQNSLGSFLTSHGAAGDMTWYVVNQAAWGRGMQDLSGNVVKYKSITAAPTTRIYAVLAGKVTNDADPLYGIITNAVLAADSPTTNDSNYWRIVLVRASVFSVHDFGTRSIPTANMGAENVFSTLAWSHSERTLDVGTNTKVWITNSLEPV